MTSATDDIDQLRADQLVELAGSPELSTADFTGLQVLLDSIWDEAALSLDGLAEAVHSLTAALRTRSELNLLRVDRPELAEAAIERPVFITGLHRTGTTYLQSLLAAHPQLRAPELWELMAPASRTEPAELILAAQRYVTAYYRLAPEFRNIHPLDAEQPEECHRLIATGFASEIYGLRYRIPGYLQWLQDQDARPSYRLHRLFLAAISLGRPTVRFVLKCPFHLWHQDAIAAVYPDARMIVLHRAPEESLGSICSLTEVIRSCRSNVVDRTEIGRYSYRRTLAAIENHLMPGSPEPLPTLHVRYPELVADPAAVLSQVNHFLELADIPVAPRTNTTSSHRHSYRLADYGLDTNRTGSTFADYRRARGV